MKRGVKKELLSKQNGPIEVIQSSILKSNDEEAKSKMSDWCRTLRADEAHLLWMTNDEGRKRKIEEIERIFNCYWEDKFKEVCESYNQESASESINLDVVTFRNWAKQLNLKPQYKESKHGSKASNHPRRSTMKKDVKEYFQELCSKAGQSKSKKKIKSCFKKS